MNGNGASSKAMTPKQIVSELDKYIIGQHKAKRMVAIAIRNRWRRQMVDGNLRDEIMPNNIIMIGATGVGKTEIARRLANLVNAPFIKVEASKFTEVGYVGRDVESMVRDLTDISVNAVKKEKQEQIKTKARKMAEEKLLDILLPSSTKKRVDQLLSEDETNADKSLAAREKLREQLQAGKLDKRIVEIDVSLNRFPVVEIFSPMGMEELGVNMQEMFSGLNPRKTKKRRMTVLEAMDVLEAEEAGKLIDMDDVIAEAIDGVENNGMIFVDEIDKIAGEKSKSGPDISREGVQRDILPIVEGTSVMTKYGLVRTDHILFLAAGAFHVSKPSDLIPELQGRFPIRVELDDLKVEDFVRILTEPENALIRQYTALLKTEGVSVSFDNTAIEEIARIAFEVNSKTENIGARRLQTVMTKLLETVMFDAPETKSKRIRFTKKLVRETLNEIIKDEDLSRYIL